MHFPTSIVFGSLSLACLAAAFPSYESSTDLYSRDAEPEAFLAADGAELIPREWLEARDPMGLTHLGDDGVLRQLKVRVPDIARRDEHLLQARYEVVDAFPLSPAQIKRYVEFSSSTQSAHVKRHLEETFMGIDGRDVHPRDQLDPHPQFIPRSPGTVEDMRELLTRSAIEEQNPLTRRNSCSGSCSTNADCYRAAGSNADATNCHCNTADMVHPSCYWAGGPNAKSKKGGH